MPYLVPLAPFVRQLAAIAAVAELFLSVASDLAAACGGDVAT